MQIIEGGGRWLDEPLEPHEVGTYEYSKPIHVLFELIDELFLLLACYVPNVAKEEYMRSV